MASSALPLWRAGAGLAALGVSTGALGSHWLGKQTAITPSHLSSWSTASQYAFVNGVALLAISSHPRFSRHWAGKAVAIGAAIFSISIYALVLNREKKVPILSKIAGPATPLGGLIMIAGYIALAL